MKKNIFVIIIVVFLLTAVIGFGFYISNDRITKINDEIKIQYQIGQIINNQINEAIYFTENIIGISLAQALLDNQCQIYYLKNKELQSKYASFKIEGTPNNQDIENPYSDSGCYVKITYGQGKLNNYSNDIQDKILYLSFTNGGNFIIVPNKTTLDKKYWPYLKK